MARITPKTRIASVVASAILASCGTGLPSGNAAAPHTTMGIAAKACDPAKQSCMKFAPLKRGASKMKNRSPKRMH